jgi:23S rRNA (guanosine2251-2'-O)-methyltransferase
MVRLELAEPRKIVARLLDRKFMNRRNWRQTRPHGAKRGQTESHDRPVSRDRTGSRDHTGSRDRSMQQRAPARPRAPQNSASLDELIMGRNCVEEVLRHCPARLREVFLAEMRDDAGAGGKARQTNLRDDLEGAGVLIREVRREELDNMVQSQSHQGVVARVAPRVMLTFDELLERVARDEEVKIIALDGVLDPQNFGAILRAAECFGITAVLWSRNRAAPLGPVVAKVSVGASELVPLCPVSNLHRALASLREAGAWTIGAVVAPDAISLELFDKPKKWVLVMGSEGEGIQRLIEESLDFRVYISMLGALSSLNVSQATAVMLHALAR